MNFFRQHHKLKRVTESQFLEAYESDDDREVTLNRNISKEQQQRYIHINESLTKRIQNYQRKQETKSEPRNIGTLKDKRIQDKGYTING